MNKINLIVSAFLMSASVTASAGIIQEFSDSTIWTEITVGSGEDKSGSFDRVYPGWGGQDFDAERLFVKLAGNILSIGLQTGFDIEDGHYQHTDNRDYYAGDLALGFNGGGLDYAIDFGLYTEDYDGDEVGDNSGSAGIDNQGLYKDVSWNNDIYFSKSSPFAMESGELVIDALTSNNGGSQTAVSDGLVSYYRIVELDITKLGFDITELDAQWTMSCGNDVVYGSTDIPPTSVPEPSSIALLSTGLIGLLGGLFVRRKRNQKL